MAPTMIGKYRIDEKLGEGGMGIVYKAWDTVLERAVALKMIHPTFAQNEIFLKRFLSEAKALAKLENPNIVNVFDLQEAPEGLYIVMQFVDGMTLANKLQRDGPMSWREALPIFKQILTAVGYAHQVGVIHRDLKPANVMITNLGVAKVMDFGLAKIREGKLASGASSGLLGTPLYMPPEQVHGLKNVNEKSDIYSLGMTFYEMLAGRLPFENVSNEAAILYAILSEEFSSPDRLNPDLPTVLASIVMMAIEKEPSRRFQNTEEMLKAVEDFETEHLSSSIPQRKLERENRKQRFRQTIPLRRDNERRRATVAISSVVFIIALALTIGSLFWDKPSSNEAENQINQQLAADSTTEPEVMQASALSHSPLIKELAEILETNALQEKLNEHRQSFRLAVGNKEDFDPPDGCYVFVVDESNVLGVYRFESNLYHSVNSSEKLSDLSDRFLGKTPIWVKDLTAMSSAKP